MGDMKIMQGYDGTVCAAMMVCGKNGHEAILCSTEAQSCNLFNAFVTSSHYG